MIAKTDSGWKTLFAPPNPAPALTLQNVGLLRGGRFVLRGVTAAWGAGTVVHLRGPNGAGKSSLLRALAGALPLAEGSILWNQEDYLENNSRVHARRLAHLPPDDRAQRPLETPLDDLRYWAAVRGSTVDPRAALEAVGLAELALRPIRTLSAGQRRRLSIARLLLARAPLWLMDEPLNALDTAGAAMLESLMTAQAASGGIVVVAAHQPVAVATDTLQLGGGA